MSGHSGQESRCAGGHECGVYNGVDVSGYACCRGGALKGYGDGDADAGWEVEGDKLVGGRSEL